MELRCVLFDFDGVIADTEPMNASYCARALLKCGVVMSEADRRGITGSRGEQTISPLLLRAEHPVTYEEFLKIRMGIGNPYENDELHAEPGLVPLLGALRKAGIRTAVVSSTNARLILAGLNRLALLPMFDAVLCGDMMTRHKPDPQPYLDAMALLGAAPGQSLVVEDSAFGIHAGVASGATVVAYTGGSIEHDTHEAHYTAAAFDSISSLIRENGWAAI